MKHFLSSTKKSGFTLVEMLAYTAILVGMFLVILTMVFSFTKSHRELVALRAIDETGISAMERMTRDIRAATSIDSANSTFGSSNGVLSIIQTSSAGVSMTTKFYLQNRVLKVNVNNVYEGPLSQTKTLITGLTFTSLSSTYSSGIKIDMTVQATSSPTTTRSKTFRTTIILRGAQ